MVAGSLLAKAGWGDSNSFAGSRKRFSRPSQKWQNLQARVVVDPITRFPKNRPKAHPRRFAWSGFQVGSERPPESHAELNALRLESNTDVYAVDLPTGLGEESIDPDAVVADFTLTIGFPKSRPFPGLMCQIFRHIVVIDLLGLLEPCVAELDRTMLSSAESLRKFVPRRLFDSHKGDFGGSGLSGSRGLVGASILSLKPPPALARGSFRYMSRKRSTISWCARLLRKLWSNRPVTFGRYSTNGWTVWASVPALVRSPSRNPGSGHRVHRTDGGRRRRSQRQVQTCAGAPSDAASR